MRPPRAADANTVGALPLITRRSLLRTSAVAAAAALAGFRPWAPALATGAASHLARSSYTGLVGERFRAGAVEIRLLSVADLAGSAVDPSLAGSEDAFVLSFAGPIEPALGAGTRTFSHPALGTFELFVSPVQQPREDQRYEAVIDRSVGAPASPPKRAATPGSEPAAAVAEPPASAPAATTARRRLLRRVALRRTSRGARAEVVLGRTARARRVEARLIRRGKTVAVATRKVRERRAVLRFAGERALPAGEYTLLLTVITRSGRVSARRRVTLR